MGLEQTPAPHVWVAFYGYTHDRLNLEAPTKIGTFLRERMATTEGRRIVFIESPTSTPSSVKNYKKDIIEYGFANAVLYDALSTEFQFRDPTVEEVLERRKKIDDSNQDTVVRLGLVHQDFVHAYFLAKEIDLLRKPPFGLVTEFEFHPQADVTRLERLFNNALDYRDKAKLSFVEGSFDAMVKHHRRHFDLIGSYCATRERAITETLLKPLIKSLLKSPQGGFIGLPYGRTHAPLMDDLARTFGRTPQVRLETVTVPKHPRYLQMVRDLKAKKGVSDLVLVQDHLEELLQQKVEEYASSSDQLSTYAQNFETIYGEVVDLVDSLDLENIRRICQEKLDLMQLLQIHPLAAKTRELLLSHH